MNCYYAIRLTPEQSISLYGFLNAKRTLTWNDIIQHSHIKLKTCISVGIKPSKLYTLQPDIKEWIKYEKVNVQDMPMLEAWTPNPFTDFKCTIGDLVIYRNVITPQILVKAGISFRILYEKYGVNQDIMKLLKYSIDDWLSLGISQQFIEKCNFESKDWTQIFGQCSKEEVIDTINRHSYCSR